MFKEEWIIYEVLSGSRAYGLHTENSDYDYRGICIPDREFLYSPFKNFEQYEDKENDRTIFGLEKFMKLATNCNPNVIELLFIDEKHIKTMTKEGELLRENRNLFLTAKAKHTYTGYAFAQLKRIKNHKKWFDNPIRKPKREDFGLKEKNEIFENATIKSLIDNFRNYISGNLTNGLEEKFNLNKTILSDTISDLLLQLPKDFFSRFSIKFFSHITEELIKPEYQDLLKKEYEYYVKYREWKNYEQWKKNRNPERAKMEELKGYDFKHGSHLLRLLYNGKEILEKGTLTPDVSNIDDVVRCRKGEMNYEELIEKAEELNNEIEELYKNKEFVVSNKPDLKEIEELYFKILELRGVR